MRMRTRLALALAVALAAGGSVAAGGTAVAASTASRPVFRVHGGVVFNSAIGSKSTQYAINNKIKAAIDHSGWGSRIRIMSWNVMSKSATDHLLAAQRRGAQVQVIMDASNWSAEVPNPQFRRLKVGLAAGNHAKTAHGVSGAKVCQHSCRGTGGAAHAKYYLFSHAGASERIVMEGSANLTVAAATNQWNDLYTWVGNKSMYSFAVGVFNQAWTDKPVTDQWVSNGGSWGSLNFAPASGPGFKGFPVDQILSKVKCTGAVHGNKYHHTIIRMFPDVMRGNRGLRNARQLKTLWDRGCDVEIGYTVLGEDAYHVLRAKTGRGPVPMHHMAVDNNHDGEFDLYFHLKALVVNGVVGTNRSAWRLVQGSSNCSDYATVSDENMAVWYNNAALTKRYQAHMDYWYAHAPKQTPLSPTSNVPAARMMVARPMLTPSGTSAMAPDGYVAPGARVIDPKTGQIVNPYAHVAMD